MGNLEIKFFKESKMRKGKYGLVITMLVLFIFGMACMNGCKKEPSPPKPSEIRKPATAPAPAVPAKPAAPAEANKPK
jgi:hypothetical protein